jgi:anthranilate phosphoribosyltransferase
VPRGIKLSLILRKTQRKCAVRSEPRGEVVSFPAGEALLGGDASRNAEITKAVLSGDDGARRKVVVLNAALAIVAGGKAPTIAEGIRVAEECIDSGAAIKKLQALIEMSRS